MLKNLKRYISQMYIFIYIYSQLHCVAGSTLVKRKIQIYKANIFRCKKKKHITKKHGENEDSYILNVLNFPYIF